MAAAAAVAAQEIRRTQARQPLAGSRIEQLGVEIEQRPARWPLVRNRADPVIGADRTVSGQWAMKFKALLAVQNLGPGDAGLSFGDPEWRPAQRDTHAGDGALIAAFIDVGEFILVERTITDAQPERVERGVTPIPGLVRWLEAPRDDMLEIHGDFAPSTSACISLRTVLILSGKSGCDVTVRQCNARPPAGLCLQAIEVYDKHVY